MNLYLDEMIQGMKDTLELYKQGNNIFEMKSGNLFPNVEKQQMWQFSRGAKHIHFSDGTHTYSFSGELGEHDAELEKVPDVPLPDLFKDSISKGKAQVHRSDPGSIYFTLQEGTKNPTYTFRHQSESKWKAIPKKKKIKAQLAEPAFIENVNVESVKEGMLKMAEELLKEGNGGLPGFFNQAGGQLLEGAVNVPMTAALAPGRIGGAPGSNGIANAAKAGLIGAGAGLGYDQIKRHFFNTPEENEEEGVGKTLTRMAIPAAGMAGLNAAERSLFPNYYQLASQGKTPYLTDGPD